VKSKTITVDYHRHCDKCYDVHCQFPVLIGVSCKVIKCRTNCSATFHMCKEEEHKLLCPNEMVPCLNVNYGCPLTMLRHKLSKHLEVCPASVVCCSQEWNRWPVSENDLAFYRNVSENHQTERNLDVAMALRDQELLFRSIKMKNVFPELMEEDGAAGINSPAGEATCSLDVGAFQENGCTRMEEELSQEELDALAKSRDVDGIQNYSSWEKVFNKEEGGCKQTMKNLKKKEGKGNAKEEHESSNCQARTRDSQRRQENASASQTMDGVAGFAPWEDGVLERLGREVNKAEYNRYLVQNGAMLINFGQFPACTPRENDFVYGKLEPIEVKTVRTFNVPTSYRAKRNYLRDSRQKVKMDVGVDTADLGVSVEDLPKCDEISATLLHSLEKELKGHLISESVGRDGFYVDIGTQTYNFASSPFKHDATLADVVADKPHGLCVQVESESITRRHNKASSAFSYMCGHFFRRDEYSSHFRNPDVPSLLCEDGKTFSPQRNASHNQDPLSSLPLEILQHIAGYLDSFTLSQLSQVSHLMRGVWEFSSLFSSVDRWSFSNNPSMSDHLKTCTFYQREEHTEPVALVCLGEVSDKHREAKHNRKCS
ncbi:hypothetical protein KUCAC02_005141, partial [Chaenocephalus aceratus]